MSSNILEGLIKQKDFIIKNKIFSMIKEYNLGLYEVLLIIYFTNQDVPTLDIESISKTIFVEQKDILTAFSSLTSKGLLNIEVIKEGNKVSEVVNLDNIYKSMVDNIQVNIKKANTESIFEKFEKEFSRTLSPYEYEIINDWIEKNISEELILGALKEATYNGVSSLRYIDKIIYDWGKKGFKNMNDVNKYLSTKQKSNVNEIKEYNWLDEE